MIKTERSRNKANWIKISNLGDIFAKVGWFKNAKYDNNTNVASVACTHEFGDPNNNIPVRSFMRSTANEKQNEWKALASDLLKENLDVKESLETLCMNVEGDIRKKITEITEPPLKESTVKGRASRRYSKKTTDSGSLRKPLVDSGLMLASVSHEVGKSRLVGEK